MAGAADRLRSTSVAGIAVAALVAILAAALLRHAFADDYPFDLAYFLVAGTVWGSGGDPYGPAFAIAANGMIAPENAIWAYPPQWWGITVALASLEPTTAVHVWKGIKLALLAVGSVLLLKTVSSTGSGRLRSLGVIAAVVLLLTADATRISLHLGQTSEVVFFGIALLLFGAARTQLWTMAIGLTLLCLKPQFGLFFVLLGLATERLRPAACAALALSGAACLPILWSQGLAGALESVWHWMHNLGLYGSLDWNRPIELTGPSHLAALAGLSAPSPLFSIAVALAATLRIAARRSGRGEAMDASHLCLVGLAMVSALAPLHAYDLVYLPLFLMLAPMLRPWAIAAVGFANLLIWRTSSTAFEAFAYERSASFDGAFIGSVIQAGAATAAAGLVLVAMLWGFRPGAARP